MKTALCGIVKNEQSSVLEWIVYHRLLGFDTIILIDDQSTDRTVYRIQQAARCHDVRLERLTESGEERQSRAYARVCAEHGAEFSWIAFFDLDEYLVPCRQETLQQLLESRSADSGIVLPWLMFGSSGHVAAPGGFVIEEFQRRSSLEFGPNRHAKSIIRPDRLVRTINPHCFEVHGRQSLCDGQAVEWESPGVLRTMPEDSAWYVHHYFTRSRGHWAERLTRGQLGGWIRTWGDFDLYDRNEVADGSATWAVPTMRAEVARIIGTPEGELAA